MQRSRDRVFVCYLAAALAAAACATAVSAWGVGFSPTSERARERFSWSLHESLSQRRNAFFGHREFSDLLSALNVLSVSVDALLEADLPPGAAPAAEQSKRTALRFGDAVRDLAFLSKFHLGMFEIYLLPANVLLFGRNDAEGAQPVVEMGVADPRGGEQIKLLGAILHHAFRRDLNQAARYYRLLQEKPGAAKFFGELADKLERGDDPFVNSPVVAKTLCELVTKTFPQSIDVLRLRHPQCLNP